MKKYFYYVAKMALIPVIFMSSCQNQQSKAVAENPAKTETKAETAEVKKISFDADSAFSYVAKQCDFGPRVPNSEAHRKCGDFLASELKRFGAEVIEQKADLKAYDGTVLKSKNIIGQFYPDKNRRVALFAHWDSRPFCDNDPNPANHRKPVMGANDGASGVGVLLEVARQIQANEPNIGIDIVFFDSEDYGTPQFYDGPEQEHTWCLGSQYWGRNPHYKTRPEFGILLDMVGGEMPEFKVDKVSYDFASAFVYKVWSKAAELKHDDVFKMEQGGFITDDHFYVNQLTMIPTVDIIDFNNERGFPETWHTVNDVLENIDKNTLRKVGEVVCGVIYSEK